MSKPCSQCPWRQENHGKRSSGGFYTKKNLARLWNGVRRGNAHSCHMTDPSHPDHVAAGCKLGATAQECTGIIVVIRREFSRMADAEGNIGAEDVKRYRSTRKRGLTRDGLLYWLMSRLQMGGVPLIGGPKLPEVEDDPTIRLPEFLEG